MRSTLIALMVLLLLALGAIAGEVTGVVTNSDGDPVEGAIVIMHPIRVRGPHPRRPLLIRTRTDENGAFSFENERLRGPVALRAFHRGDGMAFTRARVPEDGVVEVEMQLQRHRRPGGRDGPRGL